MDLLDAIGVTREGLDELAMLLFSSGQRVLTFAELDLQCREKVLKLALQAARIRSALMTPRIPSGTAGIPYVGANGMPRYL